MLVVSQLFVLILGLFLSFQGIMSEQFPYSKQNHSQYQNPKEGFTIKLDLEKNHCYLDLHLSRHLIANGFVEIFQTENQKNNTERKPEEMELCHYVGKIRHVRNSWVAVSTCEGIDGYLYDGRGTYNFTDLHVWNEITSTSRNTTHLSVLNYENAHMKFICGGNMSEAGTSGLNETTGSLVNQTTKLEQDDSFGNATRYIELMLVIDTNFYIGLDRNTTRVYRRCKDIVNLLNAFYQKFKLFVAIVAIDIWSVTNKVNILPADIDNSLENLGTYVSDLLTYDHVDYVELLTSEKLSMKKLNGTSIQANGASKYRGMCSHNESYGIVYDTMNSTDVLSTASILYLQLAHNMGLKNEKKECFTGSQQSNCSYEVIEKVLQNNSFPCLNDKPASPFKKYTPEVYKTSVEPSFGETWAKRYVYFIIILVSGTIAVWALNEYGDLICDKCVAWCSLCRFHARVNPQEGRRQREETNERAQIEDVAL